MESWPCPPSLPRDLRENMQSPFNRCLLYDMNFAGMDAKMNPDATQAQVDVRSVHECTPNSNEAQTKTSQHEVFTLQRHGEHWAIDSVQRAPAAP